MSLKNYKNAWPLICDECVDDGDYLWFSYLHQNGLYRLKKGCTCAEFISEFPGQEKVKFRLYKAVVESQDKLVFAPGSATEIAVYDKSKNYFSMIPFENLEGPRKIWCRDFAKFWCAMGYNDYVYMFGRGYPGIIQLDINTFNIKYITNWVDEVEKKYDIKGESGYLYNGVRVNNEVFFGLNCADALFSFSLETCEYKIHDLKTGIDSFKGIVYDGESLWLTPCFQDNLVKYELKDERCHLIDVSRYIDNEKEGSPFATPMLFDHDVLLFPMIGEYVIKVDRGTLEVSECEILQSFYEMDKIRNVGSQDGINACISLDEDDSLFINGNNALWIVCSSKYDIKRTFFVTADKKHSREIYSRFICDYYEKKWDKTRIVGENETYSLSEFCEYLKGM